MAADPAFEDQNGNGGEKEQTCRISNFEKLQANPFYAAGFPL